MDVEAIPVDLGKRTAVASLPDKGRLIGLVRTCLVPWITLRGKGRRKICGEDLKT